jgi:hypothetical protein
MLERVVILGPVPLLDQPDLFTDRDHRLDEPVELGERLALGRLHHQRTRHGKAQRRGVEPVVDQSLGDVLGRDAARILEGPQIEDALVGYAAVAPRVERGEVVAEPGAHVIGREDRRFRGLPQAVGAHHPAVHPADR